MLWGIAQGFFFQHACLALYLLRCLDVRRRTVPGSGTALAKQAHLKRVKHMIFEIQLNCRYLLRFSNAEDYTHNSETPHRFRKLCTQAEGDAVGRDNGAALPDAQASLSSATDRQLNPSYRTRQLLCRTKRQVLGLILVDAALQRMEHGQIMRDTQRTDKTRLVNFDQKG